MKGVSAGLKYLLSSIGLSLQKEYKTDAGKANMQLVVILGVLLFAAMTSDVVEKLINFVLAFWDKKLELLPKYLIPALLISIPVVGIWCVSRVAKIELDRQPVEVDE